MNVSDLLARAEAGSTPAQAILGIALLEGIECPVDYPEAFRWLSAASQKGAARAMLHLGRMFEEGLHVVADASRARELYQLSAVRGEFLAQVRLARLLANGNAGSPDPDGALRWYRQALSQAVHVEDCPELEEARAFVATHSTGA